MSTGHELPGSNLLNVEDRRASTQNDSEPGSGGEEELPNVKTMDFISSNPKCPLEIVHESSVFEGSSKGSDDIPAMQFSLDDMPAMHFSKQPLGRLQLPRMERYALDKVPSPIKVRAERNANGASTSDLSPPSSPKRKRETDHKQDLMDVAFTAVLPAKVSGLPRSHSTF
ncbi:unnamed protein product [Sphagnum compactum]